MSVGALRLNSKTLTSGFLFIMPDWLPVTGYEDVGSRQSFLVCKWRGLVRKGGNFVSELVGQPALLPNYKREFSWLRHCARSVLGQRILNAVRLAGTWGLFIPAERGICAAIDTGFKLAWSPYHRLTLGRPPGQQPGANHYCRGGRQTPSRQVNLSEPVTFSGTN